VLCDPNWVYTIAFTDNISNGDYMMNGQQKQKQKQKQNKQKRKKKTQVCLCKTVTFTATLFNIS